MNYQKQMSVNRNPFLLAPLVREKALEAVQECKNQGYEIAIFEGWRSPERQGELFSQGRKTPGKIVTRATPFFTFHNYGLAVDIAYLVKGKWTWEGDFDRVIPVFTSHGFDEPPSFEKAHFQMSMGYSVQQVRLMVEASTMQGMWLALGLV
jgi:peptidoglycan LD-endopeptidase CwlK